MCVFVSEHVCVCVWTSMYEHVLCVWVSVLCAHVHAINVCTANAVGAKLHVQY